MNAYCIHFLFLLIIKLIGDKMYLYSGGKTGGHIMPLISVIKEDNNKGIFIGQNGALEEKVCKNNNVSFIGLKGHKNKLLMGINGYKLLKDKLKNVKIDALLTTGGYVSLAACLYAIKKRIPIFLLEENVVLGSLNKKIYPFCKKLLLTYDIEKNRIKRALTGLPIRQDNKMKLAMKYDVLIIGGSLGSRPLCELALEVSKKYKVCLIAGRFYKEYKQGENLDVIEYSNDIYNLIKASRIIIARSGASTAQEIFMLQKPFITIPSMKTKGNHQYYNAKFYSEKNASFMVLENEMNDRVMNIINNIIINPEIEVNMKEAQARLYKPFAAMKILNIIRENI